MRPPTVHSIMTASVPVQIMVSTLCMHTCIRPCLTLPLLLRPSETNTDALGRVSVRIWLVPTRARPTNALSTVGMRPDSALDGRKRVRSRATSVLLHHTSCAALL